MTGVVTLSIEVELAWGVHDIGEFEHLSEDGQPERDCLDRLLACCEEVDVPITFDVVGHLCESACDGYHEGPHEAGWFDADPGTDVASDPLYYAPDMVDAILQAPTDHEVCTHTYSHVPFDLVCDEVGRWELERSQAVLEETVGSRPVSIVPPRHRYPPDGALREVGIEIMRMSRETGDRNLISRVKELLVGPHPVFEHQIVDGVLETYCATYPSLPSSALPSGERPPPPEFQRLPLRVRQYLHEQYLRRAVDHAVETGGHCHLWSHLYDLANDLQMPGIESFLGYLAERRAAGDVEVCTMAELNDRIRDRSTEVIARASD